MRGNNIVCNGHREAISNLPCPETTPMRHPKSRKITNTNMVNIGLKYQRYSWETVNRISVGCAKQKQQMSYIIDKLHKFLYLKEIILPFVFNINFPTIKGEACPYDQESPNFHTTTSQTLARPIKCDCYKYDLYWS